jgi:hypothetical protein
MNVYDLSGLDIKANKSGLNMKGIGKKYRVLKCV